MKFLNFNRVLCLSPHPDDVEYSMAGVVLKYQDTHFDILCLTQGGDCDVTTDSNRYQEVIDAWDASGATNYSLHFSEIKFLKEKGTDEWINYIERVYTTQFNYNCIMTPSEYDSHFEHVLISSFAAPLSRNNPYSIIQYKSPSTLEKWIPNLFVSLGEFYYIKKNMLSKFTSQLHRPYFFNDVLNGFHTDFQCMKKGKGYVEFYKIVTLYE